MAGVEFFIYDGKKINSLCKKNDNMRDINNKNINI